MRYVWGCQQRINGAACRRAARQHVWLCRRCGGSSTTAACWASGARQHLGGSAQQRLGGGGLRQGQGVGGALRVRECNAQAGMQQNGGKLLKHATDTASTGSAMRRKPARRWRCNAAIRRQQMQQQLIAATAAGWVMYVSITLDTAKCVTAQGAAKQAGRRCNAALGMQQQCKHSNGAASAAMGIACVNSKRCSIVTALAAYASRVSCISCHQHNARQANGLGLVGASGGALSAICGWRRLTSTA